MSQSVRRRELSVPSAARLLSSLRDLGYDFPNAVADLIDNSVAANASRVDITIGLAGHESWVRIADNGTGVAGDAISEAMRLGAARSYEPDDLGKFGLGLKTASLSQCRLLTVASRTNPNRRVIECRQLDLDDIERRDKWETIHPSAADRPAEVVAPLSDHPGTVVLWQHLDRIVGRRDPFGALAERRLLSLAERLDLHLGMVFGRFISGAARRRRPLRITINGSVVEAWDPFCVDEQTEPLPERDLIVAGSVVRYRPFVLPPQREFSSEDAWRRASGPNQWNRQQGFYIYRADRMIQSGGWSWLRGQDEHIKLARAALEFWPDLDEAFQINISKMRVKLPEDLRDQLKPLVSSLTRRAEARYRVSARDGRAPARVGRATPPPAPDPQQRRQPAADGGNGSAVPLSRSGPSGQIPLVPGHASVGAALERIATQIGESDALTRIRMRLRADDPEVARDLGW